MSRVSGGKPGSGARRQLSTVGRSEFPGNGGVQRETHTRRTWAEWTGRLGSGHHLVSPPWALSKPHGEMDWAPRGEDSI